MMFTRCIHTFHFCSSQDANVELIQSKVLADCSSNVLGHKYNFAPLVMKIGKLD